MVRNKYKYMILLLPLMIFVSCVAEVPVNVPEDGYWKNHAVKYNKNYDKVWNAADQAANEIGWKIKYSDKPTGKIQFEHAWVIDPLFGKVQRTYSRPGKKVAEESNVTSYLHKISYWTKLTPPQAPPNPQFTSEKLNIDVSKVNDSSTKIKANYSLWPYFDYKIGQLGNARSRGVLEEAYYARVNQILNSEIIIPPQPIEIIDVYELSDVFFDFDKSYIRQDAMPVLQQNAQTMKENPELTVVINGFADIRGTSTYNLRLGKKRAEATRNYLVQLGINPKRIIALTKGETTQFAPGSTESEFQLNRRSRFLPVDPMAPVIYPQ